MNTTAAQQYTRCPACKTTFRITPHQLALREGQVRCGRCRTIFNAFTALYNYKGRRMPGPGMEATQTDTMTLRDFADGMQEDFTVVKRHHDTPSGKAARPAPPVKTAQTEREREAALAESERRVQRAIEAAQKAKNALEPQRSPSARRTSESASQVAKPAQAAKPALSAATKISASPSAKTSASPSARVTSSAAAKVSGSKSARATAPRYGLEKSSSADAALVKPKDKSDLKLAAPSTDDPLAKMRSSSREKDREQRARNETEAQRRKRKRKEARRIVEEMAQADSALDIVLQTGKHTWWERHGLPMWARPIFYTVAFVAMIFLLLAQVILTFHDTIAYAQPATRVWVAKTCEVLGCTVSPYKDPLVLNKSLVIASHELLRAQGRENRYTLLVTLRNNTKSALAFPLLRLEVNDPRSNKLVLRRYFKPEEYLPSTLMVETGIPGEDKTDVQIVFDSANVLESYTLLLSYSSL